MLTLFAPFLLFISLFLILIIYYYYVHFSTKNQLVNIPKIEPNISDTNAIFSDVLIKYPKIYGKTFWIMVGLQPMLFSSDLELVQIVLSSQNHVDKPNIVKLLKKVANNGLIAAEENIWRQHRKALNPSFHYKLFEDFLKTFNIQSNQLIKDLETHTKDDSIEILSKAKLWSFKQAVQNILGLNLNENQNENLLYMENLVTLSEIIFERIIDPFQYFDLTYFFSRNYWRERKAIKIMNEYVLKVIKKKREEILKNNRCVKADSLEIMVKAWINKEWSLQDVLDEVHTLLFAGYDTTALTLSYTIYNFSNHPEMQDKAYEEVKEIFGNNPNQDLTIDLLNKMKYLEMFLKESMRIYTVGGLLPRKLGEDVKWGELKLTKGLIVVIPIYAIHNDPDNYPEPKKTIPERFTKENIKKRHPYAFVPFSAGPRNCLGLKYAMLAVKTCLAKLLLNYKFVSVGHQLQRSVHITISSKNGVKIRLEKR